MLVSTAFNGLFSERFFRNLVPIPATNDFKIGAIAPEFELPNITHFNKIKLSSYRGVKPVLVDFTRIFTEQHYCPLCYPHIKALNQNYEKFVAKGVEVLMITSTEPQQSQKVVRDLGLKMPLLSDPSCLTFRDYSVGQALGAPLPAQFLLDKQGKLRFKHLFSFFSPNAEIETLLRAINKL